MGPDDCAPRPLEDLIPPDMPGFDRVLVDAPCSGLGTLRRKPDTRWRVGPDDPASLAETQHALLRSAAATLRPGGVLVYSTCTVLPEENEDLVQSFLADTPNFQRAPVEDIAPELRPLLDADGALRVMPHLHDCDGFFAARLVRASCAAARRASLPRSSRPTSRAWAQNWRRWKRPAPTGSTST